MPLIFESTGLLESEAHKKLKLLVEQNNGGNLLPPVMNQIQWKLSWLYASFTAIARERLTLGVEEEDNCWTNLETSLQVLRREIRTVMTISTSVIRISMIGTLMSKEIIL